jgi:hypothetical protein
MELGIGGCIKFQARNLAFQLLRNAVGEKTYELYSRTERCLKCLACKVWGE